MQAKTIAKKALVHSILVRSGALIWTSKSPSWKSFKGGGADNYVTNRFLNTSSVTDMLRHLNGTRYNSGGASHASQYSMKSLIIS